MRWFSKTPIIENYADFRAFTRPVLEAVYGFRSPYRFLRGTFVQVGFRQCIIQYDRDARFAGTTKYPLFKMINLSIDALLGFSAMPIRVISLLSIILWGMSLLYLVKSLIEHFILKITVPGWTSIIVLMTFFTGLILFSIAVIGSYVGRIYLQGQNPPLYWLSDARNIDRELIKGRAAVLPEIRLSQRILAGREGKKFEC
jgi:dolichol-phosphate mannosyltransferase